MTDLSPAAQAVLYAAHNAPEGRDSYRMSAAAALRAVAEHCVPDDSEGYWIYIPHVLPVADELDPPNS